MKVRTRYKLMMAANGFSSGFCVALALALAFEAETATDKVLCAVFIFMIVVLVAVLLRQAAGWKRLDAEWVEARAADERWLQARESQYRRDVLAGVYGREARIAQLLEDAMDRKMTDAEREVARRSFTYDNAAIDNPNVTREMVDRAADELARELKLKREREINHEVQNERRRAVVRAAKEKRGLR